MPSRRLVRLGSVASVLGGLLFFSTFVVWLFQSARDMRHPSWHVYAVATILIGLGLVAVDALHAGSLGRRAWLGLNFGHGGVLLWLASYAVGFLLQSTPTFSAELLNLRLFMAGDAFLLPGILLLVSPSQRPGRLPTWASGLLLIGSLGMLPTRIISFLWAGAVGRTAAQFQYWTFLSPDTPLVLLMHVEGVSRFGFAAGWVLLGIGLWRASGLKPVVPSAAIETDDRPPTVTSAEASEPPLDGDHQPLPPTNSPAESQPSRVMAAPPAIAHAQPSRFWPALGLVGSLLGWLYTVLCLILLAAWFGVAMAVPMLAGILAAMAAWLVAPLSLPRLVRLLTSLPLTSALLTWLLAWLALGDQRPATLPIGVMLAGTAGGAIAASLAIGSGSALLLLWRFGRSRLARVTTVAVAMIGSLWLAIGSAAGVWLAASTEPSRNVAVTAMGLAWQGEHEEAEEWFALARTIALETRGLNHPVLAEILFVEGRWYSERKDFEHADELYREAAAILETSPGYAPRLHGYLLLHLARRAEAQDRLDEAEQHVRQAMTVMRPDATPTTTARAEERAEVLSVLGLVLSRRGRYREAEKALLEAIALAEKLPADRPTADSTLAEALTGLGEALKNRGRLAEARAALERALRIRERRLGHDHPATARALHDLGNLVRFQGHFVEAETYLRQALAIRERYYGADSPLVANTVVSLAIVHHARGHPIEAEMLARQALTLFEQADLETGRTSLGMADASELLSWLEAKQDRLVSAEGRARRALAIREAILGSDHLEVAASLDNLARILIARGRPAEAEPLARRAAGIVANILGPAHFRLLPLVHLQAIAASAAGNGAEANQLYQRTIQLAETALGPSHPQLAVYLRDYAAVLRRQGQAEAAAALEARARAIARPAP